MTEDSSSIVFYTKWLTIVTSILAVATIGLFIVTGLMSYYTQQMVSVATQQMESLDITKRQARAYVQFDGFGIDKLTFSPDPSNQMVSGHIVPGTNAFMTVNNTGESPALHLIKKADSSFIVNPVDCDQVRHASLDAKIILSQQSHESAGQILSAKTPARFPVNPLKAIAKEDIDYFEKGGSSLVITVLVTYTDIFAKAHFRKSAFVFSNQALGPSPFLMNYSECYDDVDE